MHATNNNNSTSAIDLTYIYTLSIVKIKSIGNQTNSPKIRKDSCNHLRKLVLINTFIERKMAVYGEILKSKRNQQQQQQQQQQRQQLVHQMPPLTPPPSPPMNKRFVMPPPQNLQQKQQLPPSQPPSQPPPSLQQPPQQSQQPPQPRMKKAGYSYGGGFKRVQQKQQRPFQLVQPIQIYGNQIQIVPQKAGFNSVQQPQIHWIPIQVPTHQNHQMHYGYSMVQTQEQQLYLQQHVFLPPHPRGPHAPLAKLGRRPQLVRM